MSAQPNRLDGGSGVDRSKPLSFTFDGKRYRGYRGDTLASALLANGVTLFGRSFKYHRPRGLLSAGPEEPNALVTLREGGRREPNTRATQVELYEGLVAISQNRWPSLSADIMAVNDWAAPFLTAGFYYKTFMWPKSFWEPVYERFIRKAAGMGKAATEPDPDRYEKRHAFCDVIIVGAGPAGLAAAREAGESGARVILVDETPALGGSLLGSSETVEGQPAEAWVNGQAAALADMADAKIMTRTTAFGYYDDNIVGLVERVSDHLPVPDPFKPRQTLWTVRAKQAVLATGAIERPLVFGDNDRPGVMLASAARRYLNRFGVTPGKRIVVFTNNDSAYEAAFDLAEAGVEIVRLVDARETPPSDFAQRADVLGIRVAAGSAVARVDGKRGVKSATFGRLTSAGDAFTGGMETVPCDAVLMSGGWAPTVHLHSQSGGKPVYDARQTCFVPGEARLPQVSAGACLAHWDTEDCIADGAEAGSRAAVAAGFETKTPKRPSVIRRTAEIPVRPLWETPDAPGRPAKKFVDFQTDVSTGDVALAHSEGYESVEHLKRYTVMGMGTDQGKTSNVNGLALMARRTGRSIPETGATTFRPPYTPVAIGALTGRATGEHFMPTRRTPMHDWHVEHGAEFVDAGPWRRARYYPKPGETIRDAYIREAAHVRAKVGMVDVSTLGKIDVQGPDAAEFLNRVYANGWKTLPVGKARYGLMLREDGIVLDDGTTTRLSDTRYFMTTTTANAGKIMTHLEYYLQVVWPELKAHVVSETEQWAAMAIAGPLSRNAIAAAVEDIDMSGEALPFMGLAEGHLKGGVPCRVFRISFSGELAYEINVPARYGRWAWETLMAAGEAFEMIPYGAEALGALRIEKGHVTGAELDGRTTLDDVGLAKMASAKKHYIGRAMMQREGFVDPDRPKLVGVRTVDPSAPLGAGAHFVEDGTPGKPARSLGHVSSTTYSPVVGGNIALGFIQGGLARAGQQVYAADPVRGRHTPVIVCNPCFYDPSGSSMHV